MRGYVYRICMNFLLNTAAIPNFACTKDKINYHIFINERGDLNYDGFCFAGKQHFRR